jgi:integration host factor subunit beta
LGTPILVPQIFIHYQALYILLDSLFFCLFFHNRGAIMTRKDLIFALKAEFPHLYESDITEIVRVFFQTIENALAKGGRAEIRGFGTFGLKSYKAQTVRNPGTGQTMEMPERQVPCFRAGKRLLHQINKSTR